MLDLVSEPLLVAMIGGFGGVLLGLAARIGRFCTLGAIEDYLYGGSDLRLRMWVIAIGMAVFGSFGLMALGLLDSSATTYLGQGWNVAGAIIGGLVFGYGMAMAGNCGYGALARLGGGDLRSFVIVLVMGVSAYVAMSGPLAKARIMMFPIQRPTDTPGLAHWIQGITGLPATGIGMLIGLALIALALTSQAMRHSPKSILWSAVVGLSIVLGWAGTQWVATSGWDALPVVSHTFSAPIGEAILYAMTSSGASLSFGVGSVAGVWVGAFVGSLYKGHFRWEACEDPRELRRQIIGAALVGIGGVTSIGCSVGQGLSAFSLLAFSAPLTFVSIFAGAALGLRQLITGFAPAE